MKTVAYLRVSTGSQNLDNQKLAILDSTRPVTLAEAPFVRSRRFWRGCWTATEVTRRERDRGFPERGRDKGHGWDSSR